MPAFTLQEWCGRDRHWMECKPVNSYCLHRQGLPTCVRQPQGWGWGATGTSFSEDVTPEPIDDKEAEGKAFQTEETGKRGNTKISMWELIHLTNHFLSQRYGQHCFSYWDKSETR